MAATAKPLTIISDALATFATSAHSAFSAVEDDARAQVARATAETREARREREEALSTLHASQLEQQAWKQEVVAWKAAVDQAEMTIKHQAETIGQLRREALQWKDQCLRLEETARQEALDWKEQFLRVEQERSRLSLRIDDLVSEQLSYNQSSIGATPFTPQNRATIAEPSTSSTATKRASTSSHVLRRSTYKPGNLPSPIDHESPTEILQKGSSQSAKTSRTGGNSASAPRRKVLAHQTSPAGPAQARAQNQTVYIQVPTPQNHSTRKSAHAQRPPSPSRRESENLPRQTLIRRVQAVIEVPVKEEDDEDDFDPSESASGSGLGSGSVSTSATSQPRLQHRSEEDGDEEGEEVLEEADDDVDSDEASAEEKGDDEDDELMMGAEENHKELYGTERISAPGVRTSRSTTSVTARPAGSSTSKKRKLTGGSSSRPVAKVKKI